MVKRILAALCVSALALACCGCGNNQNVPSSTTSLSTTAAPTTAPKGHVRYINPNPSLQDAWEEIAADFSQQTGISVTIIPAADAAGITPTLFTVDDEEQLAAVSEVCLDLAGVNATHHIQDWSLTLYENGKMCGLPLEAEGYGLIYNDELLRKVGVTAGDINSFAKLTEVVNNISANSALKFEPFACMDLNSAAISLLATIPGDIRPFWDLYIANTACTNVITDEDGPLDEIAEGKAVFCIGSTKEFEILSNMSEGNLNIMPLYIGGENEARQGLCLRVENYLCVRSDVAQIDIEATLDFLDYLTHPREDSVPIDRLEIFTPYSTAKFYASPLEKTLRDHISTGRKLMGFSQLSSTEGLIYGLTTYTADPTDENWALVAALLQ